MPPLPSTTAPWRKAWTSMRAGSPRSSCCRLRAVACGGTGARIRDPRARVVDGRLGDAGPAPPAFAPRLCRHCPRLPLHGAKPGRACAPARRARAAAGCVPLPVEEPVRESVILVHGLWMGGWAMQGLRLLLSRRGYAATALDYRSMAQSLDEHARRLAALELLQAACRCLWRNRCANP